MSDEVVLKFEGVSRFYQQAEQVVKALDNVDLELKRGEFVALAGPSGSGKTTLLNVAAGLDRPSQGRIWMGGEEITGLRRTRLAQLRLERIGFVFQSHNLVPVLSAEENAEFVLLLRGVPRSLRRDKVRTILKEVGLEGLETRRPAQLSGGQQQRVAVARAIVSEPTLVLADEPTANLDSQTAVSLLDLMSHLNQEHGTTFLFSTHDPRVMQRAHRIVQLVDGRIDTNRAIRDPDYA